MNMYTIHKSQTEVTLSHPSTASHLKATKDIPYTASMVDKPKVQKPLIDSHSLRIWLKVIIDLHIDNIQKYPTKYS